MAETKVRTRSAAGVARRTFMRLAAGAAVLPGLSPAAWALDYPTRPVTIIVPVPPGGALDILARLMGQWLGQRLGQSFVVENRPGGGTNIGVEVVVRAAADGYTLLLIPGSVTANAALYQDLRFNFIRDIAPIAMISQLPMVMEVNSSPGLEGIQKTTGVDVADAVIEHIERAVTFQPDPGAGEKRAS